MKNLQMLQEGPWKSHCIKEIAGLKKLKRRSREVVIKQVNGFPSFKVDEVLGGAGQERVATTSSVTGAKVLGMRSDDDEEDEEEEEEEDALDLTSGAFMAAAGLTAGGSSQNKKGLMGAGFDAQSYAEQQRLQPRIVMCQRAPESPYLSVSEQVTYSDSPDPSASPLRRLGEAAGVSTEIKAIQQTRRLLANARERTRVHTISAAFEALRKQVPCYSYGQKLSKLAILRIACNYILSLAKLADLDYSADHSNLSFSECVEQCTRTLQSEGRSKKRKGKKTTF
ncbi:transcription factor ATOH8 isoform X2 [Ascaphus truei]|uniref:transcription factor ATOH8 isoform X2 n=1 Tax=Ascaphus truei TaxID=8439 RepID=UPI003F599CE5